MALQPGIFDKTDMYRRKWRQVQFLTDLLQPRGKWRKAIPNLKPNALVLMVDDSQPRGRWNVCRVLEVLVFEYSFLALHWFSPRSYEGERAVSYICQ